MLVMIAWILYFPEQFGIEFSAMVGICADLVFGSHLRRARYFIYHLWGDGWLVTPRYRLSFTLASNCGSWTACDFLGAIKVSSWCLGKLTNFLGAHTLSSSVFKFVLDTTR